MKNEVSMLRYEEVARLQDSIKNPVTKHLVGVALMKVLNRFLTRKKLPISDFDIYFFADVMLEFCNDHELIQRILNEEDLEKYYF